MDKFIVKETEKAILVKAKIENWIVEREKTILVWLPKSAITIENGQIIIAKWVIERNMLRQRGDTFNGLQIVK